MSTWAGLTAKLLLADDAVPTLFCRVEEWEVQAVTNILSVSHLCLFCVSNGTKWAVSTAESGGAHGEGKGGGGSSTDHFERTQKIEGRQRVWVTVFWKSSDFTVRSVVSSCSLGVQNQNQRPQNEYNISSFRRTEGRTVSVQALSCCRVCGNLTCVWWFDSLFEQKN